MSISSGSLLHAYTTHLMRVHNVTNAFSDPVPVGYRWVARTISVAYGGQLGTIVSVYVADLLVVTVSLFTQPSGPSYVNDFGYYALDPGERFHVLSSAQDQGVDCYISGYQLLL